MSEQDYNTPASVLLMDKIITIRFENEELRLKLLESIEEIKKLTNEIAVKDTLIEKLSKRHPTKEEALAQYEFIKNNSKRIKR